MLYIRLPHNNTMHVHSQYADVFNVHVHRIYTDLPSPRWNVYMCLDIVSIFHSSYMRCMGRTYNFARLSFRTYEKYLFTRKVHMLILCISLSIYIIEPWSPSFYRCATASRSIFDYSRNVALPMALSFPRFEPRFELGFGAARLLPETCLDARLCGIYITLEQIHFLPPPSPIHHFIAPHKTAGNLRKGIYRRPIDRLR